jgi:hypothetical protein
MGNSKTEATPDGHTQIAAGKTHRWYHFNGTDDGSELDDLTIEVPPGAEFMAIRKPVENLAYEIHTAARAGVDARDSRCEIAAAATEPARPVTPGEFLNISNQDGSSEVGEFELMFEGAADLPNGVAALIAGGYVNP